MSVFILGSRSRLNKSVGFDVDRYINSVNQTTNKAEFPVEKSVIQNVFADFKLPKDLSTSLRDNNFVILTVIQDQAILEILAGHDVVGIANTGTGKTLAFVLSLLANIIKTSKKERVLIMTPPRPKRTTFTALAEQAEQARKESLLPLSSIIN